MRRGSALDSRVEWRAERRVCIDRYNVKAGGAAAKRKAHYSRHSGWWSYPHHPCVVRTQRRDNSFFRFSSPICAHAHERRRGVWVCAGFLLCVTSTCVGADLLLLLHCFDRGNLRSCLLCAVGASLCVVGHLTRALCLLLCLRNLARGRVLLCGKSVCVVGRRAGE